MTDYIERDELVSYFKEIATKTLRDGSVQCVLGAGVIAHMIVEIKEFPSADVRPVVRSSWELLANGDGICQNCGSLQKHIWDVDGWQNFCGHCGSDMREKTA